MSVKKVVIVVGAGPVGCLAAMSFAKQGWSVVVLESREDIRSPSFQSNSQRSINLAISHRGLAALQAIDEGSVQEFMQCAIPMKGRMIHHAHGSLDSQSYDKDGQCINSIDRTLLNKFLVDQASNFPNISISFNCKVQIIDFHKGILEVLRHPSTQPEKMSFDFCVGADGSYSIVRRQMMKVVNMDYQQEYIPAEYIETKIPPKIDASGNPSFVLDPHHLHIWPRHSFMLIALPNKDKSFTCTLFAPPSELDTLVDESSVLSWFELHFPDALQLIGRETVVSDVLNHPRSSLICTKSYPYHYKDRGILLGDAAHSMVPFYGQGLNCGLEDVRILDSLLKQRDIHAVHPNTGEEDLALSAALSVYSKNRHEDLIAICELAMENYVEMRHKVLSPLYLFKRVVDNALQRLTSRPKMSLAALNPTLSETAFPAEPPSSWLPLYTMVTFRPDISYATARRKALRQDRILKIVGLTTLGMVSAGVGMRWFKR